VSAKPRERPEAHGRQNRPRAAPSPKSGTAIRPDQMTVKQLTQFLASGGKLDAATESALRKPFLELQAVFERFQAEAASMYAALDDGGIPALERRMEGQRPSAGGIAFLVFLAEKKYKSEQGLKRGARKHAKLQIAKDFALKAWSEQEAGYKSKAEFARHLSAIIKRMFGLEVTSDTIKDKWLPKTRRPPPK
jgi:hypothetical protein